MNTVMTMQEAEESIQKLREIFDVVRLLDAEVIENINRKNDTEIQDQNQDQRDGCCRKSNPEVFPEFVLHLTALSIACSNRRVGNKRKIIPKHGTAHNRGHTKCQIKSGCRGNCRRDRRQKRDGSYRGSHRHRYKAGNYKQYRH